MQLGLIGQGNCFEHLLFADAGNEFNMTETSREDEA